MTSQWTGEPVAFTRRCPVAIIGSGISGLSAAWTLQQRGIPWVMFERDGRPGGKILTETVELPGIPGGRFVIDFGPESFITRKPDVWQLARDLGLQERIQPITSETRGVSVLYRGEVHRLPLSPVAFLRSRLLSWRGKLRLLAEPFITPRTDQQDETLASFARRRLGTEAGQRLIEPILGGIYNTDPEVQSVLVSAPQMRYLEREHGGLFRGTFATVRHKAKAKREQQQTLSSEPLPPTFITFKAGAGELVAALLEQLTGTIHLHADVTAITATAAGYAVRLADGAVHEVGGVLLATPAPVTARLLAGMLPAISDQLAQFKASSLGTMSLAYPAAAIPATMPRGLMIPRGEGRKLDAMLWTSARLAGRAPDGYALIRVFFGGSTPAMATLPEADLLAAVRGELADLFRLTAEPLFYRAYRWQGSYPLAEVGHLERVAAIRSALPAGIWLANSFYGGVGVPDCVREGREAAEAAAAFVTAQAAQVATFVDSKNTAFEEIKL